jgi:hypothetical protein
VNNVCGNAVAFDRDGVFGLAKGKMFRITNRTLIRALALLVLSLTPYVSVAQTVRDLKSVFREDVGLTDEQIASIRGGKPVVKVMPSRTPDEVFLFGAVYIQAAPESYG